MRTENSYAVAKALDKKPATITELRARTGLSYATVKRGLEMVGAVRVENSWPVKWTKPAGAIDLKLSPEIASVGLPTLALSTQAVLVDLIQDDDILARWQDRQEAFAAELKNLVVQPDSDPKKLSVALATGASALASLAYAIAEHEGKPDWFSILGGTLDSFETPVVS